MLSLAVWGRGSCRCRGCGTNRKALHSRAPDPPAPLALPQPVSVCPSPQGLVPGQQRLPDPGSLQPLLHADPPRLRHEEAPAPEQRGQRAGTLGLLGPTARHSSASWAPRAGPALGRPLGVVVKWVPPTLGTDHGQSGCGASPHPWGQSREWEPPAREAASVSATCHGVGLPTASRLPPPATGSLCAPQMATGCPVSGPPSLCVRPAPALGFLSQNWLVALTWPSLRVPVPPGQGGDAGQPAGHRGGLQSAQGRV